MLRLIAVVNAILVPILRRRVLRNSVLHVSYMVHIPYHTTRLLRRHGVRADYLAIGRSPYWNIADFVFEPSWFPALRVLQEAWTFWSVMARYEVVHAHFGMTISRTGWELPVLKRLGRRLVVHFRGCEARDRERNMALHPGCNICDECDYSPPICKLPQSQRGRELARRYGDVILVTTPDMLDFNPDAHHFPFFAPDIVQPSESNLAPRREFKIVHATNHPGIEGTRHIEAAVERLKAKGWPIRFVWMHGRRPDEVLAELADADLAIGKMKMGYYANAQIESMALGIPTITFVRESLMTDELWRSGFIFSTIDKLETTIERFLREPESLAERRRISRDSILRLHNNEILVARLIAFYRGEVGSMRTRYDA